MKAFGRVFSNEAKRGVTSDGCVVHVNTAEVNWRRLTGFNNGKYDLAIIFKDDVWCGWFAEIIYGSFTLYVWGDECLDYDGTLDEKVDYIKNLIFNNIIYTGKQPSPIKPILISGIYNIKHLIIKDTMFDID